MAGTVEGGKKASLKNKQLHGEDFYKRIGHIGGKNGHTGGFASNPELAREAGRKGGKKSRRGKSKKTLKEADGGKSEKD
jgi:general stress protein YciG